jgi:uncharacterized protein YndB with AHSA1/START domain
MVLAPIVGSVDILAIVRDGCSWWRNKERWIHGKAHRCVERVPRRQECGAQFLRGAVGEVTNYHEPTIITFPNELEIEISRQFVAPVDVVFDVFTKPEHVRKTFAPFGEEMTECSIGLRVGGNYHFVMVTDDGIECSFRGTYLEVEPPTRTVETWMFEGWPTVEAIETKKLRDANGVTNVTWTLAFRDVKDRNHMTAFDGIESNLNFVEDYLKSLLNPRESASSELRRA